MRRLVYALSLSTLFFAVCTADLARELYLERDGETAAPALDPSARSAPSGLGAAPAAAATRSAESTASASAKSSVPAAAPTQPLEHGAEAVVVSQASPDPGKVLAQLQDPVQRAAMLEERKSMFRSMYRDLAEVLDMDGAEFERFIDLQARHQLAMHEASTRCYIENSCGTARADRGLMKAQQREMADLFGTETMEAFERYQFTMSERGMVSELRG